MSDSPFEIADYSVKEPMLGTGKRRLENVYVVSAIESEPFLCRKLASAGLTRRFWSIWSYL